MTYSVIAVSLAVCAFFAYHAVCKIHSICNDTRRREEIKELRKELDDALENGYVGRAAYLRQRLSQLLDEQ